MGVESILVDVLPRRDRKHDWRAMSKNANYTKANTAQENRTGVDPEEREELLLDDLRHEVSRLADAVERQNELLNESTSEADLE